MNMYHNNIPNDNGQLERFSLKDEPEYPNPCKITPKIISHYLFIINSSKRQKKNTNIYRAF